LFCFLEDCLPPLLRSIPNGAISINQDLYMMGETLNYTCNDDFDTKDEHVTECREDFTWTLDYPNGNPPQCLRSTTTYDFNILLIIKQLVPGFQKLTFPYFRNLYSLSVVSEILLISTFFTSNHLAFKLIYFQTIHENWKLIVQSDLLLIFSFVGGVL